MDGITSNNYVQLARANHLISNKRASMKVTQKTVDSNPVTPVHKPTLSSLVKMYSKGYFTSTSKEAEYDRNNNNNNNNNNNAGYKAKNINPVHGSNNGMNPNPNLTNEAPDCVKSKKSGSAKNNFVNDRWTVNADGDNPQANDIAADTDHRQDKHLSLIHI